MTSDVIGQGENRAPQSHGICRAPDCPIAEEAKPVELYPGPGQYCPECGTILEPVPSVAPAAAAIFATAEEAAAASAAPLATAQAAPPAAAPQAAPTVTAPAAPPLPVVSAPAAAASAQADPRAEEPASSFRGPSAAYTEAEPSTNSASRKRIVIGAGLAAILVVGGVVAVRSMTAPPPEASIAVRVRPSAAPHLRTRATGRPDIETEVAARAGAVGLSTQDASSLQATPIPTPTERPAPTPHPSLRPAAKIVAATSPPTPTQQLQARKVKPAPALLAALPKATNRPRGGQTVANSKIGAPGNTDSPQPAGTQAAAASIPATTLAVALSATPRPTATPLSCARPDMPPAIVNAAAPETPLIAAQQGITGTVNVIVSLNAQNHVVATRVQSSTSGLLNRAALVAARTSQYRTQIVNCEPVGADYVLEVNFTR